MSTWSAITANLIPHGFCLSWQPGLMVAHIGADAITAAAYSTIPFHLLKLVRERKDLQFSWVFVLFGLFIMACGATHVMSLWTLWFPDYLASAVVKVITALASVGTALVLVPLIPKAIALPGPAQWQAVNDDLRQQVEERSKAEAEVRRLNGELEARVQQRTAELQVANDHLSALHGELEERVRQRTAELRQAQAELIDSARQAGMAEIATNVLHNVGNVLNSVNVSAGVITQQLRQSKLPGLGRAVGLLQEHEGDLAPFLTDTEQGRRLPGYLARLSVVLVDEQRAMGDELGQMGRSIEHIKDIVATQQAYAGGSSSLVATRVEQLIDDALRMNAGALSRHQITVVRQIEPMPELLIDKHKVLQILINLISNAKQAMDTENSRGHCLTLAAHITADQRLCIRVADEGDGISPEHLTRIFAHGFTTRANGHGFGLHSCVVAAREMDGSLVARSDGPGLGATFTLEVPARPSADTPS
ncbi:histidine kinase/DNA gyrase B/HSP90-like ATPase [Sphaerotilus hippei]|uniref:histidine kinase n=1 Tax=Sphaerotilus hippei TaxID=744406 RepID=A0A318HDR3_9BURK|nr:ATP-binding protein [Sphaerotilus hippei]PXW99389.1 histidine kinase/DNA gyrase B/HSP90-like ATPase [Sphaerotilus hippei]